MADPNISQDETTRKARRKARAAAHYLANRDRIRERHKAYNAARYKEKKAELIAKRMAWAKANPDKHQAADRRSYQKNAEKRRAAARERYLANREKKLAREKELRDQRRSGPPRVPMTNEEKKIKQLAYLKIWRTNNREKYRTAAKEWHKNNPDRVRILHQRNKARRKGAIGTFTTEDIDRIYKAQNGRCAYCKTKLTKKVATHLDHIKPLSKGGTNYPSNLQLTCVSCNLSKHAKDPINFAQERGLLL